MSNPVSLAAAGLLAALGPQEQDSAGQRWLRGACEELATLCYEADPASLDLQEPPYTELVRQSAEELAAAAVGAGPRGFVYLLQSLGHWSAEDQAGWEEGAVRELVHTHPLRYRPREHGLVWASPSEGTERESLLKELVLVWRDRQSGLERLRAAAGTDWDRATALECTLQGEAELAYLALECGRMRMDLERLEPWCMRFPGPASVDRCLRRPIAVIGARYALETWQRGGWEAVRASPETAPSSTEQILHPLALDRDLPTAVELPDLADVLGPEARLESEDTLGELAILALLVQCSVDEDRAREAACGWDGDRLGVYRLADGSRLVSWRTLWDRPLDAEQMADVLRSRGDGWVLRSDRRVDWVRSPDPALDERVLARLGELPFTAALDVRDAAATAAAEERLVRARAPAPFEHDGHWIVPELELALPLPKEWRVRELGGLACLQRRHLRSDAVVRYTHDARPPDLDLEHRAEQRVLFLGAERADIEVVPRELFGRSAFEARARVGGPLEPRELRIVCVRSEQGIATLELDCAGEDCADALGDFQAMLAQARAPQNEGSWPQLAWAIERPSVPRPSGERDVRVEVRRRGGAPPAAIADVWVVPESTSWSPGISSMTAELAIRHGRHYRSEPDGGVWLRRLHQDSTVFAREGELHGERKIDGSIGAPIDLVLDPELDLRVLVRDAEDRPVSNVPLVLLFRDEHGAERFCELGRSAGARGEARFDSVLHALPSDVRPSDLRVGLGFPHAPQVSQPVEVGSDEAIVLRMPPTGSLVLEREPLDSGSEVLGLQYGLPPEVRIAPIGNPAQTCASGVAAGLGPDTTEFPIVGLGLDLEVRYGYSPIRRRIRGPEQPGEQKRVDLRRSCSLSFLFSLPSHAADAPSFDPPFALQLRDCASGRIHDTVALLPAPGSGTWQVFDGLSEGTYAIDVLGLDDRPLQVKGLPETICIQSGNPRPVIRVDLDEEEWSPLVVRLLDEQGEPLPGDIRILEPGGSWAAYGLESSFSVWRHRGPLVLEARAPGYRVQRLSEGEPAEVALHLIPELRVRLEPPSAEGPRVDADPQPVLGPPDPRLPSQAGRLCLRLSQELGPDARLEDVWAAGFPLAPDCTTYTGEPLELGAPGPGRYRVTWLLRRGERSVPLRMGAEVQRIELVESDSVQVHELRLPSIQAVESARARLDL